jgi:hypothetical protein
VSSTTQLGTHLDALNHLQIGDRGYNGWTVSELAEPWGTTRLGAETIPQIVTSGWLVDVPATWCTPSRPVWPTKHSTCAASVLRWGKRPSVTPNDNSGTHERHGQGLTRVHGRSPGRNQVGCAIAGKAEKTNEQHGIQERQVAASPQRWRQ